MSKVETHGFEARSNSGWMGEPDWASMGRIPDGELRLAQELIYREALLLDMGRIGEWFQLWAPSARYWIPLVWDAEEPDNQLNIVYADYSMLRDRVERLLAGKVPSQQPPSRTAHALSNVLVHRAEDGGVFARAALTLTEVRPERQEIYGGHCSYLLSPIAGSSGLFISQKKVLLANCDQYLGNLTFLL